MDHSLETEFTCTIPFFVPTRNLRMQHLLHRASQSRSGPNPRGSGPTHANSWRNWPIYSRPLLQRLL